MKGRNAAYCFPGPEKQAHCLSLGKGIGKHKSFGERPRVDGLPIGAMEKDVLLILHIMSIKQVTT